RTTTEGVRLFAEPVREVEGLRGRKHAWGERTLHPGENLLAGIAGDLFDVRVECVPAAAEAFGFTVRGVPVVYDVRKQEIACKGRAAPLPPSDGKVRLRLLIDRGSFEVFGNDGRVALSVGVIPPDENRALEAFSRGGGTRLRS